MSRFTLRRVASGIKFDLRAGNGQVILTSEVYTTRASALKGVASVRRIAPEAPLADLTQTEETCPGNPRFEVYQDRAGEFRFRLRSRNGKIVGISEGYSARMGCLNGIDSVRKNAPGAEIAE